MEIIMEIEKTAQELADMEQYALARKYARQLLEAMHGLEAMQTRWNALDSGNTMIAGEGSFNGLVASDVGAVVFATADAVRGLLNAGHGTNLAKVA
jgi:hypothetical protein